MDVFFRSMTDYKQEQKDEIEAIESIYSEEIDILNDNPHRLGNKETMGVFIMSRFLGLPFLSKRMNSMMKKQMRGCGFCSNSHIPILILM